MPSSAGALVRVLVHGDSRADAAWLEDLRQGLPDAATLVLCGAQAEGPGAALRRPDFAADSPAALLAAARAAYPGDHLALVRSGTALPPHWLARLRAALALDDALVASPLDNTAPERSPLPTGAHSTLAAEALDRFVCAYGSRRACGTDAISPLLSLWHGARLARVDIAELQGTTLPARWAPLRALLLDHLYVADPARALRGPAAPAPGSDAPPPSPLGTVRAALGDALHAPPPSARHGLDGRPVLLHVLHGWGGGAERFVRDLAAADSAHSHLVLLARGTYARRRYGEVLELHDGNLAGPALRRWPLPRAIVDTALADADYAAVLAQVRADFAPAAVLVSSLIGHSLDVLRTGLPTVVVAHDCYPLWPLLHRDFGDPGLAFDAAQRAADLRGAGADYEFAERDPRHWQALRDACVAAVCSAQAHLVAPSRSALANVLRLAPEWRALPQRVIAHGLAPWPAGGGPLAAPDDAERRPLRLVLPGRVRRGKGAELLRAALPGLRGHAEVFLLGAGADGMDFFGECGVHVVLDYRRDELPQLLATLRPDAALLLPAVAETFSYTLSECWSLGLPVIATRVGALAERIAEGETGFLVAPDGAAVATRVAQLAADRGALQRVRANLRTHAPRTLHAMAVDYAGLLAPLLGATPATTVAVAGPDALRAADLAERAAAQAAELLRQRRQLAEQQAELGRRADWALGLDRERRRAVARIDQLQVELGESTQWAQGLDAEVRRLAPQAAEREAMLASTSWRLTAPLRTAKLRWRNLRTRLTFLLGRLRTAWQRTRGSLRRRGLLGTLRRARQELARGTPTLAPVAQAPDERFAPFALPTSDAPRVSVVIPVYNKIAYTVACLRSLAQHADATPFEVIVVDDGSSDATAVRLAQIDGLRVLRNAQNLGFVGSCNAGAAAARGEFVFFLNNDTVVTAGWLQALLCCFSEEADAGLVGARLVYPDGRLQEAGGIVFRDGSGWNYGRFDDPGDPRYGFRRETDYCSGAAILIRRELFQRLGGFDARYAPAYYEDTDLAFAVRAAGLKVYYEPRATVIHFEGISAGTDTTSGMKRYQVVNRDKFREKWAAALAHQPAPIDDARDALRAATFRAQRRILIIDACTPTPDQDSGSLRMVNLMRLLRSLGWQVSFFAENRAYVAGYTEAVQALGVEVQYHPYLADPVRFFRERGAEFDAIVLSRHYIAIHYLGLARLYAPQARLVFDTVDLHYLREQRAAELADDAALRRQAAQTRAQEHKLMRECDVTLVVSPVEQELLARELPQVRVEILSNVHEVHGCRRPFAARTDLVFVGSFQHPPNVDAVLWFARDVLPVVRAQLPDVRLHVIGQPVPAEIAALAGEGLVAHGFVADLEPFMDGCRVSVAPLRYGAGVKGKVNMAMSYGLPVVATPMAVEGMHLVQGDEVLVAADAGAFAAAVLRLYGDEALWQRLSRGGLANVQRHFSFAAAQQALQRILG